MVASREYEASDFGLPGDYESLGEQEKRQARLQLLTGWHDLSQPSVLCTDTEAFVQALRFFVEIYLKGADVGGKRYFNRDPEFKYEIVRAVMAQAIIPTEPSKCVIQACRGGTKTETVIHQCALLVAVARPGTQILICEANDVRTKEEIKKLRRQVEENQLIHGDFGGANVLFTSKRNGKFSWNDSKLEFLNGSTIMGVSTMAAHRGRHPDWVVIDDPEKDKKKSQNPQWRREYFQWLFFVVMGMLRRGANLTWIGTPVDEFSCLSLAMRGHSQLDTEDGVQEGEVDTRFDDWVRRRFNLIYENTEGERHSAYPDHVSVDAFDAKVKAIGYAAAMSELQGDAVVEGDHVFERSDYKHGYMKCVRESGTASEAYYMLDLKTGDTVPWDEFVDSLAVFGANDIADSTAPDADPCSSVFIGVSEDGVVYVLDAWTRRTLVDKHVPQAFRMAAKWNCQAMGWEQAALQRVVVRWAKTLTRELRAAGETPPVHVSVSNHKQLGSKIQRIVGTLTPLFVKERIRLPHFEKVVLNDGTEHVPAPNPHRRYLVELRNVIDTFTDQGPSGYIDVADALEMAVRVAKGRRGSRMVETEPDNAEVLERWQELGVNFGDNVIPMDCHTPEMQREKQEVAVAAGVSDMWSMDPYE